MGSQSAGAASETMSSMWSDAGEAFEKICGLSLTRGDIKNFDDVERMIEGLSAASYGFDTARDDGKRAKARRAGLNVLKYLKMLVSAASHASSFVGAKAVSTQKQADTAI
jgi:hypothetical protein